MSFAKAAEILGAAWREHAIIDALPPECRPADVDAGYAIQDAVMTALNEPLVGYKIAATSAAGQAHIAIDHPIWGQLPASRVLASGAGVSLRGNAMRVAEAEFVFSFARTLPARAEPYQWPEVQRYVGELRPGIELPNSRFRDFAAAGAAQLVADDACACTFVLGAPVAEDWRSSDLAAHAVSVHVAGELAASGTGSDALGDPRTALIWLVNELSRRGRNIEQGCFVTTGVCGRPAPIQPGQQVRADFGRFGQVRVSLHEG